MKHVRIVSLGKADVKQSDAFADLFFQIWLTVLSFIITGAFSQKR